MKHVSEMNAEELLQEVQIKASGREGYPDWREESAEEEILARVRAYDAAMKWSEDVITDKWLGVSQGAGKALRAAMLAAKGG